MNSFDEARVAIENLTFELERSRKSSGQFANEGAEGPTPETFKQAYSKNWSRVAIGGAAAAGALAVTIPQMKRFGGPGIIKSIQRAGRNRAVKAREERYRNQTANREDKIAEARRKRDAMLPRSPKTKVKTKGELKPLENHNNQPKPPVEKKTPASPPASPPKKKTQAKKKTTKVKSEPRLKPLEEMAAVFDTIAELHARIHGL